MKDIIDFLNSLVWSNALIALAFFSGIYYTISTRFVQIRQFKEMIRLLFNQSESNKGVSSFQAFAIAISGRVGTGNIAGVATAIAMGGPGAIFWMWVIAFIGASSAYIESTLGQIYKVEENGEYRGGPAYYIEKGLKSKPFALVFAFATILSCAIFLPGVQANSIATGVTAAFDISEYWTGAFVVIGLGVIVIGGVKRIGTFAEVIVPFMAGLYIIAAIVIISINFSEIPSVLSLIVSSAMGTDEAFGGIVGMSIIWGVKRGIYSNEAGQGTAPHAAAAAAVSHPAKQGLVQAFSVYVDTLFICTATALMILFTFNYNVENPEGGFLVEHIPGVVAGPEFTQNAIDSQFSGFGAYFVAIALTFFAFTTILAYYYIAETNAAYIQEKLKWKGVIRVTQFALVGMTFYGAVHTAKLAWAIGDLGVGIMAWLNLIAIFLLRKPALKALKDYENQKKAGIKEPTFDFEFIESSKKETQN